LAPIALAWHTEVLPGDAPAALPRSPSCYCRQDPFTVSSIKPDQRPQASRLQAVYRCAESRLESGRCCHKCASCVPTAPRRRLVTRQQRLAGRGSEWTLVRAAVGAGWRSSSVG